MSDCRGGATLGFPNIIASQLPGTIGPNPGQFTVQQVQAMLADAQAQFHLLVTGQQASVFVDSNGERITYTQANRDDLNQYIQGLISLLTPLTQEGFRRPFRPGPIGFIF